MSNLEIVTGAGPVGSAVALQLAEQGINVRLLRKVQKDILANPSQYDQYFPWPRLCQWNQSDQCPQ